MADDELEPPRLTLSEASQRSSLAHEAFQAKTRHGSAPSRKDNNEFTILQLPAELLATYGQVIAGPLADFVADLLSKVADLWAELARARAEREVAKAMTEAKVKAARYTAMARVQAATMEVAAMRELADRLTAELAEPRRPWCRRWIG